MCSKRFILMTRNAEDGVRPQVSFPSLPFSLTPLCLVPILSICVMAALFWAHRLVSVMPLLEKKRGNFCQNPPLTSDLTGLLWIPNPVNSKGKENSIQGRFRLMRIHLLGLAWGQLSPKLQAVWRRLRGWLSSVAVS